MAKHPSSPSLPTPFLEIAARPQVIEVESDMSAGRFCLEVAGWAAISVIAWGISARYSVFDRIVAFSHAHERWQIDDALTLIVIISVTAFLASLVQSRHQWVRRRVAERSAYMAARRDVLTNLPNRQMFTELAGLALGEAWRQGGQCAVLFVDLDGFKPVNDTYGHAAGDALLIAIAEVLRQHAPSPALPARLGGDEFAVLLPGIWEDAAAVSKAREILQAIQQPRDVAGFTVTVSATIGIAAGPEHGRRAEDLIHAADLAMYEAKRAGKGSVRVFSQKPHLRSSDSVAA